MWLLRMERARLPSRNGTEACDARWSCWPYVHSEVGKVNEEIDTEQATGID